MCVGNGDTCRRYTPQGIQQLPCPSPEACDLARTGHCKPYGRLHVIVNDEEDIGTFIFRTTGFNSIRTLVARLSYYQAISGDLLACLPFHKSYSNLLFIDLMLISCFIELVSRLMLPSNARAKLSTSGHR